VPGAGIGGLFYLITAALAPLYEGLQIARGGRARRHGWRFIARLTALAALMLSGMAAVGWLLGAALVASATAAPAPAGVAAYAASPQFIARSAVALTFGTLAGVLLGVEVLRLVVRPRAAHRRSAERNEVHSDA
jgi:hypothetical protein